MFKRIIALLCVLVLTACSTVALAADGMTTTTKNDKTSIKIKKSYPDNPVVEGVSPTTGLPASGEVYTPILMVLDNAESAYPHWGVSDADIIFQIPNAGAGATKLMALFADHYPEQAGGVRSARATMVPVAAAFEAAFAYAGQPPFQNQDGINPEYLMRKWNMKKTSRNYNLLGNLYRERVTFEDEPHNLSCQILKIHENLIKEKTKFTPRPFLFTDEPLTGGADATYIEVAHHGDSLDKASNPASFAYFTYQPETNGYIRTNSSGPYSDRFTGEVLSFSNVIVLRSKFVWHDGYFYFNKHLTGSGVAEIFQNGQYVRGAWYRQKETSRFVILGPDGKELPMQRGKSFIVVTNAVTEVSYK